MTNSCF